MVRCLYLFFKADNQDHFVCIKKGSIHSSKDKDFALYLCISC